MTGGETEGMGRDGSRIWGSGSGAWDPANKRWVEHAPLKTKTGHLFASGEQRWVLAFVLVLIDVHDSLVSGDHQMKSCTDAMQHNTSLLFSKATFNKIDSIEDEWVKQAAILMATMNAYHVWIPFHGHFHMKNISFFKWLDSKCVHVHLEMKV